MEERFYKEQILVISPVNIEITGVDIKVGKLQEEYLTVCRETLKTQEFYPKILLINDKELAQSTEKINDLLCTLRNLAPLRNEAYFMSIEHTNNLDTCTVDTSVIFCSQWNLPIFANNHRVPNTVYGDCKLHRIKMYKIPTNLV